jgi:hypothetical protein
VAEDESERAQDAHDDEQEGSYAYASSGAEGGGARHLREHATSSSGMESSARRFDLD